MSDWWLGLVRNGWKALQGSQLHPIYNKGEGLCSTCVQNPVRKLRSRAYLGRNAVVRT